MLWFCNKVRLVDCRLEFLPLELEDEEDWEEYIETFGFFDFATAFDLEDFEEFYDLLLSRWIRECDLLLPELLEFRFPPTPPSLSPPLATALPPTT